MQYNDNATRFVVYLRVSTTQQGQSGLGLEAQQNAVQTFTATRGDVISTFTEIESGKRNDRPQLALAMLEAKRTNSTLLVAKLDRLARNVAFIAGLLESGVEFQACDNPNANRMMIQMLSVFAENEARQISERTKSALAAARARGVQLGTPANLTDAHRLRGAARMRDKANTAYAGVVDKMRTLKASGLTLADIADRLNDDGHRNSRGNLFSPTTVYRVLNR